MVVNQITITFRELRGMLFSLIGALRRNVKNETFQGSTISRSLITRRTD